MSIRKELLAKYAKNRGEFNVAEHYNDPYSTSYLLNEAVFSDSDKSLWLFKLSTDPQDYCITNDRITGTISMTKPNDNYYGHVGSISIVGEVDNPGSNGAWYAEINNNQVMLEKDDNSHYNINVIFYDDERDLKNLSSIFPDSPYIPVSVKKIGYLLNIYRLANSVRTIFYALDLSRLTFKYN